MNLPRAALLTLSVGGGMALATVGYAASGNSPYPMNGNTTTTITSQDHFAPAKPLTFIYHRVTGGTDALIQIDFTRPLSKTQRSGVASLVRDWYIVGVYGGYGPYLTYLSSMTLQCGGRLLQWDVDTGDATPQAFTPLAQTLQGYSYVSHLPLAGLRVVDAIDKPACS